MNWLSRTKITIFKYGTIQTHQVTNKRRLMSSTEGLTQKNRSYYVLKKRGDGVSKALSFY